MPNIGNNTISRLILSLCSLFVLFAMPVNAQDDRSQIEKIVFLIQQGVQRQHSNVVFNLFRTDSLQNQNDAYTDKSNAKQGVDALLMNFSNRSLPDGMSGLSTTADFRMQVKDVTFSEGNKRAVAEILLGFAALPPDSSLLMEKNSVERAAMTDQEKLVTMQFRPFNLCFMKVDGSWYITSFGDFSNVVTAINRVYPNGALSAVSHKHKD